jgi:uncharacterized protein
MNKSIARWQNWSGESIEHLVLKEDHSCITADGVVLTMADNSPFAMRYRIVCDRFWRVNRVEISEIGSQVVTELVSDGIGNWSDKSDADLVPLASVIDVDISITPFTNTLPIRRLNLQAGLSAEILVAYIQAPSLDVTTDRQRYTCLVPGKLYRYESLDTDFTRDIEVDSNGLVVNYPGLFRRVF